MKKGFYSLKIKGWPFCSEHFEEEKRKKKPAADVTTGAEHVPLFSDLFLHCQSV